MKTFFKHFIFLVLLVTGIAIIFSTCRKDTDCAAVITVKLLSDTNIIVPNAKVILYKADVRDSGISDMNGHYRHTFKLEAILYVKAVLYKKELDSLNKDSLNSNSQQTLIRLIPGKTTNKSVFLDTL